MHDPGNILQSVFEEGNSGHITTPYKVDAQYFSSLETHLLNKTGTAELIAALGNLKKPTFREPSGYFDNFEEKMLGALSDNRPKKMYFPKYWYRWAAAAAFIAAISFGAGYFFKAEKQAMADQVTGAPSIDEVNNAELANFLDTEPEIADSREKKPVDINQLLQAVSSHDLQNFLNETSAPDREAF